MEKVCNTCGKREDMPAKRAKCRDCVSTYNKRYYASNRTTVLAQVKKYRAENPDKVRHAVSKSNKARWQRLRRQAFDAYGWWCACCGEDEPQFLCVDHVNNDGAAHRAEVKRQGISFGVFGWLQKNSYPDGFQTLCHNCNFSKHTNGGICIHQLTEGSTTILKGSTPKRAEARGT